MYSVVSIKIDTTEYISQVDLRIYLNQRVGRLENQTFQLILQLKALQVNFGASLIFPNL